MSINLIKYHRLTGEIDLGIISHNKIDIHILNLSARCLDWVD